jgi:hypothetical protein
MPDRRIHEAFDRFLAEKRVLLPDGKYGQVHAFMDLGVKDFGSAHRDFDYYHREEGLRRWLNGKFNVIKQDLATNWLRAGLGHICLDEKESYLDESYSLEEVFDSAYRSMIQRKWTRARFVPLRRRS